jgi:integrase
MKRGSGTIFKRGKIWYVQVYVDGKSIKESSHSSDYQVAKKLRDRLLGKRASGELGGRNAKVTIGAVLDAFLKVLPTRAGAETLQIQTLVINANVRPFFGAKRAEKITTDDLLAYRDQRKTTKSNRGTPISDSTINRELSLLRNAMRTAALRTPPMISMASIPHFPITNEDACARQGFITDAEFELLVAELPVHLAPLAVVAYYTGIRLGELLGIRWQQVDLDARVIRLAGGQTKNGKPRTCPFLGNMEDVLLNAKWERDTLWPECPWVFHRLGEPIVGFRGAWDAACRQAGLPDLKFHDLRRSSARNLSRAGVPETVIMRITGHRTRAMFDRYNITSEADLADAAERLAAFRASKSTATTTKTVPETVPPSKNTNGSGSLQSH